MALKENMPGLKGYVSTAGNLSNIASIINNRKKSNQQDQALELKRQALVFQQGAPQRAVEAEQAVFDLTRQRNQQANQERNAIVAGATNSTYVPSEAVKQVFATPDAIGPQPVRSDGTAGGFSTGEEDLYAFSQQMNANPEQFQDPRQISQSIAAAARANGNFDESQIASMQAQGLERFQTLGADQQKQLFSEAKTTLEQGNKVLSGGGSGSGGGQGSAAVTPAQTLAFEKDFYASGEFDDYKGGFENVLDYLIPNILASPDAARNEIDGITGQLTAISGVNKIYNMKALVSLGLLRRNGNWDTEVGKIMDDPEQMAKIEIRAKQHEAAANKKIGASQSERESGVQERLSIFKQTNDAIRAGSAPTQNSQANRLKLATGFRDEQFSGPDASAAYQAPAAQSSGATDYITVDDVDVEEDINTLEDPTPAPVKQPGGRGTIFANQSIDANAKQSPKQAPKPKATSSNRIMGRGAPKVTAKVTAKAKAAVNSKTTALFNSLTSSGKVAALGEAEKRLDDPKTTKKETEQLLAILQLAR